MGEELCYVDGLFVPRAAARVSILDRGLLMGDAIYEVVRVHNGRIFLPDRHFARMEQGLTALRIPVPFSAAEFADICAELARRNCVASGLVYLQVSRGAADRTHLIPRDIAPTVVGFSRSARVPFWAQSPGGVKAITTPDLRWGRCDLKTTMLLPNSLAKQEARDAGAYEAILVSDAGVVREGSSTNVFAWWDGVLGTHPLTRNLLPGITRAMVLELAARLGISMAEEFFTVDQLMDAEEVFLTGTTTDVCPVVAIDGKPVGTGAPGPVARRLMAGFAEIMERNTAG